MPPGLPGLKGTAELWKQAEAAQRNPNIKNIRRDKVNYDYGFKGSDGAKPLWVFDDGLKTFMKFTGDIPDYTPDLVDLVKAFQSENGLKADGVIGRATVRAMVGESNDAKIAKVQVAMEQIRWLPDVDKIEAKLKNEWASDVPIATLLCRWWYTPSARAERMR